MEKDEGRLSSAFLNGEDVSEHEVVKPWGKYKNHHTIPNVYHLKTLHLVPGAVLSLQKHQKRSETWILVSGDAVATHGNSLDELQTTTLLKDEPFRVPVHTIHRLTSEKGGVVVEIMYGTYEEDDIERFEDIYGRI